MKDDDVFINASLMKWIREHGVRDTKGLKFEKRRLEKLRTKKKH